VSNGSNTGGVASATSGLLSKPGVWEAAFIIALILLIFAHKITVEGMVEA
jgi:hypothetical protein